LEINFSECSSLTQVLILDLRHPLKCSIGLIFLFTKIRLVPAYLTLIAPLRSISLLRLFQKLMAGSAPCSALSVLHLELPYLPISQFEF
jgi:hypothetical protein